jgi:hypothetical protein
LESNVDLSSNEDPKDVQGENQIAGKSCETISKQRTIQVIDGKMILGKQAQVSFLNSVVLLHYTIS